MPRGPTKKNAASATTAPPAKASRATSKGANLGFEAQMFLATDKLRKNLEPSDYKSGVGSVIPQAASVASSIGSTIDRSSFSGLLTRPLKYRPHPHWLRRVRPHQIARVGSGSRL
jgi:hypothetical protein